MRGFPRARVLGSAGGRTQARRHAHTRAPPLRVCVRTRARASARARPRLDASALLPAFIIHGSLRAFLRTKILEQAGEGGFEGVVLLPVREVGDEVFAQLDGEVLAAVGIEALPVA